MKYRTGNITIGGVTRESTIVDYDSYSTQTGSITFDGKTFSSQMEYGVDDFYLEALEDGNITLSKIGSPVVGDCTYGVNDPTCPNDYDYGTDISLEEGDRVYFKITATTDDFTYDDHLRFSSTCKFNAGGAIRDLIGGENKIIRDFCFVNLFRECNIIGAKDLVLVDNFNEKTNCYRSLFNLCSQLLYPPKLNSVNLTDGCYYALFQKCESLTYSPVLPAKSVPDNAYYQMFAYCYQLKTPPELPAVELGISCYHNMFYEAGLTSTPSVLPALELKKSCYRAMFYKCYNLVNVNPDLIKAKKLDEDCYRAMFQYCTSLNIKINLPATDLATGCYRTMFNSCSSLTIAPDLPATVVESYCYYQMFRGCSSLKAPVMLPAKELKEYCYLHMFYDCSSIKVSETQTSEYTEEYRIPTNGDGITASNALTDFFRNTGGTFKGTPTINTTYYLKID